MSNENLTDNPPIALWEKLIPLLWCEVSEILRLCIFDMHKNNGILKLSADNDDFLNLYKGIRFNTKEPRIGKLGTKKTISNPYLPYNLQTDQHLLEGTYPAHWERYKRYPRLVELTLNACRTATTNAPRGSLIIPSPLHIIYIFLCDPNNPCTAAYALTACRNWLSSLLCVWPVMDQIAMPDSASNREFLTEPELRASVESFTNYVLIGARWPDKPASGKTKKSTTALKHTYVGSYLSLRGISHLWFSLKSNRTKQIQEFCDGYLPRREQQEQANKSAYRLFMDALFTLSNAYERIPPYEELSNQLFGYPLPIRGMDVVFNGGLRPSSSGGLVMAVSGQPGAGKTSFALALANALMPFGTPTYYLSLEETVADIKHKLDAIRPDFEKKLCITLSNDDYFNCEHIPAFSMTFEQFAEKMSEILDTIDSMPSSTATNSANIKKHPNIAGTCPGVIVVDNLSILNEDKDDQSNPNDHLENLIAYCRKTNVLTVLIIAQDLLSKYRLDYLVDFVIDLRNENLSEINDRPVRAFNLIKTRHQLARQGTHVFHMGSGRGFRIVPNMDSLMDRRRDFRLGLPDRSKTIHAINTSLEGNEKYLNIHPGSNILIHGFGSSGKAGLSLRLLLSPAVPSNLKFDHILDHDFSSIRHRQKILIISFLYPSNYYNELVLNDTKYSKALYKQLNSTYKNLPKPILDYLVLYPGFIGPQDFLNKVVAMLDEAKLSGEFYTGILIDGLHNVLLQYPRIQEADMVWAMLYNILARYTLTVVSTFTNFSVGEDHLPIPTAERRHSSSKPDEELMQKGMAPFLHSLVKATDYYLSLQEAKSTDNVTYYPLTVRSGIGQKLPEKIAIWDRTTSQIERFMTAEEFQNLLNHQAKVTD